MYVQASTYDKNKRLKAQGKAEPDFRAMCIWHGSALKTYVFIQM
jgi:hypothetical protein